MVPEIQHSVRAGRLQHGAVGFQKLERVGSAGDRAEADLVLRRAQAFDCRVFIRQREGEPVLVGGRLQAQPGDLRDLLEALRAGKRCRWCRCFRLDPAC